MAAFQAMLMELLVVTATEGIAATEGGIQNKEFGNKLK